MNRIDPIDPIDPILIESLLRRVKWSVRCQATSEVMKTPTEKCLERCRDGATGRCDKGVMQCHAMVRF